MERGVGGELGMAGRGRGASSSGWRGSSRGLLGCGAVVALLIWWSQRGGVRHTVREVGDVLGFAGERMGSVVDTKDYAIDAEDVVRGARSSGREDSGR